jgi:hypothetical protein
MTESEVVEVTRLIRTGQIYQLPKEQLQKLFIKINSPASVSDFGVSEREGFIKIIENAIQSAKEPNPTTSPATNVTNKEHNWQNKTLYYIAVGVIIALLAVFIIYLIKQQLGIPL